MLTLLTWRLTKPLYLLSLESPARGGGGAGINFDSWCSDDLSMDSSQRSCGFSAAAELQASADNAFLQVWRTDERNRGNDGKQ